MDVKVSFTYWTDNVIPPRCRKPRRVEGRSSVVVTVAEVTSDDAPVAFHVPRMGAWEDYRWWGEQVWAPHLPWSRQTEPTLPGSPQFPAEQDGRQDGWYPGGDGDGIEEATVAILRHWERYLIIDGVVWRTAGEPRYYVITFGLGHNHAGTSLSVSNGYNSNIGRNCYFRADEYEAARTEAVRVALARGDTESVPRIRTEPRIEVLIPVAVRCRPQVEHGDGDPFLNKLHAITSGAGSAFEAGLLVMATGASELA